jgi:predicted ATP-grasp superfamily ATP-dependent carboligase
VQPAGADNADDVKQATPDLMHLTVPIKAHRRHGFARSTSLGAAPELDPSVAVLLVRIGRYPLHHGTVGAIRSLGRLGVPVYTIVEDHITPAACSRYLAGRFRWPTTGQEEPEELVEGLLGIGAAIGGRPILAATDEEAAVLIAEQAARLGERFVLPAVDPGLPRRLATKYTLYSLCVEHGIPAPVSARPGSPSEVIELAGELGYPVVLKNDAPWLRLTRPAVPNTAIVTDPSELRRLVDSWVTMPTAMLQEYLPRDRASDWIAHAYFGADRDVVFTGRKLRSWPPQAGVTTYAYTSSNPEVVALTRELCRRVGFRGICDLDWRFDARASEYKLVDFNPRLGAQFRLFERGDGVDVIRAMHLDLTGRDLRSGSQVDGRLYVVENLDVPAHIAYWRAGELEHAPSPCRHRELAWWASDDPLPALVGGVCSAAFGGRALLTGKLGGYRPAGWAKGGPTGSENEREAVCASRWT